MAWVEVNNHLDDYYGYYHGIGADSGLYMFPRPEDESDYVTYIISHTLDCSLSGEGGVYNVAPYTYNEAPVFRNVAKTRYVFKSIYSGDWILFERLAEPLSYLDLDLSTYLGDGWYRLESAPNFSHRTFDFDIRLTPMGTFANRIDGEEENNDDEGAVLKNYFDCYEFKYADWRTQPYGRYENSSGDVRMFGTPIWKTSSQDRTMNQLLVRCVSNNLSVENGQVYSVGGNQLKFDDNLSCWTIGTPYNERWWEGNAKPSIDAYTQYSCYEMQEEQKTAITSADVSIRFYEFSSGSAKSQILMGEVATWH